MNQPLISQLGPVMQLAFVPRDFDAALRHWTETMGVGPFFRMEHIRLLDCRYRGEPCDADFSIALAYWGDVQIELIEQHNEAPSIYKRWRDEGREGLHHVCITVSDLARARRVCAQAGARVEQEGHVAGGGEVIYVDTGAGPGSLVEIIELPAATLDFFAGMREACRVWDGREPVRKLG
ncbi:VOC family protein [Ideonella sp. YS5]|uniref:VOC family protein n=1 Tax=Ideonella sp. YS5 TaxID=3453714 RepID=UPI003EEE1D28